MVAVLLSVICRLKRYVPVESPFTVVDALAGVTMVQWGPLTFDHFRETIWYPVEAVA